MSEEIKKIIEESRTEEELLKNLDKVGHRLSDEELEAVTGGDDDCGSDDSYYNMCGSNNLDLYRKGRSS